MRAIYCDEGCPTPSLNCVIEGNKKYWSDNSIWNTQMTRKKPDEKIYQKGKPAKSEDVLIPCPWQLVIDQDLELDTLVVDG